MSNADQHDPAASKAEPRAPVPLPVQGVAPAWEEPSAHPPQYQHSANPGNGGSDEPDAGRKAMADTCERIGKAMGSAQRQVSRGLHLVRGGRVLGFPGSRSSDGVAKPTATPNAEDAASVLRSLEEEAADAGHEAARQLGEWRNRAAERLERLRCQVLALVDAHPLETIAAIAGACFALGVAIRLRRSHHG